MRFESPREMAVVGEAGAERDLPDRLLAIGERPDGELDPHLPDVLTHGLAVPLTESLREVHRMNAGSIGHVRQTDALAKMAPEVFTGAREPGWHRCGRAKRRARRFGPQLEENSLQHELVSGELSASLAMCLRHECARARSCHAHGVRNRPNDFLDLGESLRHDL